MEPGGSKPVRGYRAVSIRRQDHPPFGGVFQRVVFHVDLAADDVLRLGTDRQQGVAEAVPNSSLGSDPVGSTVKVLAAGSGNHRPDGIPADHTLTFKLDHLGGADQHQ